MVCNYFAMLPYNIVGYVSGMIFHAKMHPKTATINQNQGCSLM